MNTELSLQMLLIISRALEHYHEHLYSEARVLQNLEDDDKDDEISDLVDEAGEVGFVISRIDDIYASQYEKEYGKPPEPVK